MAQLTLQQAAQRVGKSRTTLWRAVKGGKVSAARSEDGDFLIEESELARAFGPVSLRNDARDVAKKQHETSETNALQVEVELLRKQIQALEADKADLKQERDRLIEVIEKQTDHMKQLTYQPAEFVPAGANDQAQRWGFWPWSRGK